MCERIACMMVAGNSNREVGGWFEFFSLYQLMIGFEYIYNSCFGTAIPSPEGTRSMMKLAQRMMNNFCASLNPSPGQQLTTLLGSNEVEVRATLHRSVDPGQPNRMVLSASATIWLPVSPQNVFNFFRDERTRPQVLYDHL